ncbi:MAG: ATP-binding protein [Devosia sp.]
MPALLGDILAPLPVGVLAFDSALRLTAVNPAALRLLDLPTRLGTPGTLLADITLFAALRGDFGAGDPHRLAAAWLAELTAASGSSRQHVMASGGRLSIVSTSVPGGGVVVSCADISPGFEAERGDANAKLEARVEERTAALREANAELEGARRRADAANRDKTRFLAAASHDLLQPLNAARLYTATLVERAAGTGLAELAGAIEASLNAVEDIMSALLDLSRIDSGALTPEPRPFRLGELIGKVAVEFGPMAAERSITLRLVDCSAVVVSDRTLVGRIVQNLVSNAIKYTHPGGRVLVGCRRRGARVRLDVVDTGIGFHPDQQKLLFAEFARLEPAVRMAHGLGLGLSIVERLVAALGLGLEMASVEERGSRFSISLPVGKLAASATPAPARADRPADFAGLRVLCIDNEREVLDAMDGLLAGWGCDVRTARSLRDIDRDGVLVGWLPDLVLMDYHLEQASGLDAVEWLRQNLGGHLPAALVTADRTAAVRDLAAARGIALITKPVKPAALRATISALAAQRQGQPV